MQRSQMVPSVACESGAITRDPAASWDPIEGLPGASDSDSQENKTSSEEAAETVRS